MEISIGKSGKKSLNRKLVENIVHEIPEYRDSILSAKLKHCEGDFEKGEELNLLDFLEESLLPMQIQERKTLDFEYTINAMKNEYLGRKCTLDRMLHRS